MTRVKSQIQHDYKSLVKPPPEDGGTRGRRWFFLGLVVPVLLVAGVLVLSQGNASPSRAAPVVESPVTKTSGSSPSPVPVAEPSAPRPLEDATRNEDTPELTKPPSAATDPTVRTLSLPPRPADKSAAAPKPLEPTQHEPEHVAASSDMQRVAMVLPPSSAALDNAASPTNANPGRDDAESGDTSVEGNVTRRLALPPRRSVASSSAPNEPALPGEPLTLTVKSGDSLDALFGRHDLSRGDLATLLTLPEAKEALTLLMPGDEIEVRRDGARILGLTRALTEERTLKVTRGDDGFATQIEVTPVEIRLQHASAIINSSLFLAAKAAGISDTLTMNLAGIFAWDIDFVLDIRRGDRFSVIYEEIWQDGHYLRDGNILAARFVNDGDAFEAIRYVDPEDNPGYFTADGVNVKKAFLRAPIKFTPRVTSSFNPRRMHPVHKRVRPHRGVDYGAPTGTPILAAGDGKVIFRGRKGGYGNTVILQHGGNITTLYAHMSKFNRKVRNGSRVRQGQIIGYVGATGTVTARHLHYEYRVNGVHRNPRTVALPKARPIPKKFTAHFRDATQPLLTQLDVVSRHNDERPAVAAAD